MPQRWDAQGNPISDQPTQRWDASGNPVSAPAPAAGFTPRPEDPNMPADVRARHERQALGKGATGAFDQPGGAWNWLKRQPGQALEAVGELGQGMGGMIKGAAEAYTNPQLSGQFLGGMVKPQVEQFQKAGESLRGGHLSEAGGHALAGATPFVGPMAAEAGESFGRGEVGRGMVYGAAAFGPEKIVGMMRPALDLVRTGDAITNGMTRLAKEQVRPTLDKYVAATKAEVARHADAVINADEARGARGSRQLVQTEDAAKAAEAKAAGMRGYTMSEPVKAFINDARNGIATAVPPNTVPGSLAMTKQLITEVSDAITKLNRAKALDDASVLTELRTELSKAAQTHAEGLGSDFGRSWSQYKQVHAAKVERVGELMGDLQKGLPGTDTINSLIHPDNGPQFHQLVREMKDYGIDTTALESAREYGYKLQDTLQKTSNLFFGKIRAMIKYPLTAGAAAVGASELAKLSGIPGASFALPLIAAGKVAGILDLRQMRALLEDLHEGQMLEGRPGPTPPIDPYRKKMPPPLKPPTSGNAAATPPSAPPSLEGEPEMERLRRTGPATRETPVVEAPKEKTVGEEREQDKADYERRSKLAADQEAIDEGEAQRETRASRIKFSRRRRGR